MFYALAKGQESSNPMNTTLRSADMALPSDILANTALPHRAKGLGSLLGSVFFRDNFPQIWG